MTSFAAAQGSSVSRSTAVRTVKSPGRTCSSSSQVTGNDTGTPGRARGLYAATTVAPPALVESTNTLPPRSSRTNSVVATPGSSRAARAAKARVAAATSGISASSRSGTNTCTPLAPLVLTPPDSPASSSACRTSSAAATAIRNPSRGSTSSGGSRSRIRWVCRSLSTRISAGWYSTARWLASHTRVRRSSQTG